ncbi:hypothetical protein JCM10207_000180 [Rhodosporidiobolus poonsookiae]
MRLLTLVSLCSLALKTALSVSPVHTRLPRALNDDIKAAAEAVETLGIDAASAVGGGGKCSKVCGPWLTTTSTCNGQTDEILVARCMCARETVETMTACGNCLGGKDAEGGQDFANLCGQYAAQIAGNATLPVSAASETTGDSSHASSPTSSSLPGVLTGGSSRMVAALMTGVGMITAAVSVAVLVMGL